MENKIKGMVVVIGILREQGDCEPFCCFGPFPGAVAANRFIEDLIEQSTPPDDPSSKVEFWHIPMRPPKLPLDSLAP